MVAQVVRNHLTDLVGVIGKPDPVVTFDRHLQLSSARATHPHSRRTERRNFGFDAEPFEDNLQRRFRGTETDAFTEVHTERHHSGTKGMIWQRQIGWQRDGLLTELLILLLLLK